MAANVSVSAVVMAAGKGTRMKSDIPKCLHRVWGVPMAEWVCRAVRESGVRKTILVVGHGADLLRSTLGDEHYAYAYQLEQLGTGHAVLMARQALATHSGPVVVLSGDAPLIQAETIQTLIERHLDSGARATLATYVADDPKGYGRVIRARDGRVKAIVEEKDCTPEQKLIREVNTSVYVFDSKLLFKRLPRLKRSNVQQEYYLTDIVADLHKLGESVMAVHFEDGAQFAGVNDRWQLAEASNLMRMRILRRHALAGVSIVDPATTYIGPEVELEPDVQVEPMTALSGKTRVGRNTVVGPQSVIADSVIGEQCVVLMSHLNGATLADGAKCGPFAHLRPGAILGPCAKVGNFVEVKNSELGERACAAHLAYIGDASVGAHANIGAGTITCNYDGFSKHRTVVGESAFVGSNSTLVAPVNIGDRAFVAAGSVITGDLPEGSLGIARVRQEVKPGWADGYRKRRRETSP